VLFFVWFLKREPNVRNVNNVMYYRTRAIMAKLICALRSPEFLFLWCYIKDNTYHNNPWNLDVLKTNITKLIDTVSPMTLQAVFAICSLMLGYVWNILVHKFKIFCNKTYSKHIICTEFRNNISVTSKFQRYIWSPSSVTVQSFLWRVSLSHKTTKCLREGDGLNTTTRMVSSNAFSWRTSSSNI